tara:strand:+ start:427 stop:1836 length:1410 start_codon:yes stop_codon:yes gene_type:complete
MAGIVPSLFGPTPEELMSLRKQEQAKTISSYAPAGGRAVIGAAVGTALAGAANKLFGLEDPEIKKATDVYNILRTTQQNLGEGATDPTILYPTLQKSFADAGYGDIAEKVSTEGAAKIVDWNTKQATIKQKTFDLQQDQEAKVALQTLNAKAAEEGRTPTTEEVISALSDKLPAEKLAPLLQNASDKAAWRDMEVRRMEMAHEDRLQLARERQADKKEIEAIKLANQKELTTLKSTLNPKGGSSSVYERGYANNFVTSSAELVPASSNLNILTQGGVSPITAGVFTNLKGTGLLSATGAAFGTTITSPEAGQYESIMLPVIQNIGTMQNAGRRTTIAQLENLKTALIAKPGQPYIVQVQKMGELRQIAEAATDAALVNPALSDEQKALVKGNLEKVKQAIPFTGADVATFSVYSKKNPTVKFKDWLKVNGSDKEELGKAPQAAIDMLSKDPTLAPAFKAKYGYLPEGTK